MFHRINRLGGLNSRRLLWVLLVLVLMMLLTPSAPVSAQDNLSLANELYIAAQFDILSHRLEQAQTKLQKAVELAPGRTDIAVLLAEVLESKGLKSQAIEIYQKISEQQPGIDRNLSLHLAYLLIDEGKYQKAFEQFEALAKVDPQRSRKEKALLLIRLERYEQALKVLAQLPQDDPQIAYLTAQTHMYTGDYALAQKKAEQALTRNPPEPINRHLKSLLSAIEDYQRAERPVQGWLTLEMRYNDNVFQDPTDDNPSFVPPRNKDDMSIYSSLLLHGFAYQGRQSNLVITAGAKYEGYFELGDASYAAWNVGAFYEYYSAHWGFKIPYEFEYFYARNDLTERAEVHTLRPLLYWQMTPRFRTEFHGLLQRRIYKDDQPHSTRWGGGLLHYLLISGWDQYLRLGYRAIVDDAEDDQNGYRFYEIMVGGKTNLWGPFSLDIGLAYDHFRYDQRPEPYLIGSLGPEQAVIIRKDDQFRFTAQLFYRTSKRWVMVLGYTYTNNNSNVNVDNGFDPYRFDQNLVFLRFTWSF
jgi:tetratricopeptide (TPR) repeat protein